MMGLETIILTALMTTFFDVLGKKQNWFDRFHTWAKNQNSKFIYRLSKCRFCIIFHFGTVSFVIVAFATLFNVEYLLTPFYVAGLFKIVNYDSGV